MHKPPLLSQEIFLVLISVRGWVHPRVFVQPEGVNQWKCQRQRRESNPRPSGLWRSALSSAAVCQFRCLMYSTGSIILTSECLSRDIIRHWIPIILLVTERRSMTVCSRLLFGKHSHRTWAELRVYLALLLHLLSLPMQIKRQYFELA